MFSMKGLLNILMASTEQVIQSSVYALTMKSPTSCRVGPFVHFGISSFSSLVS